MNEKAVSKTRILICSLSLFVLVFFFRHKLPYMLYLALVSVLFSRNQLKACINYLVFQGVAQCSFRSQR